MAIRFKDPVTGLDIEVDTVAEYRALAHTNVTTLMPDAKTVRFLNSIGVTTVALADTPVVEGNYVKFMSHAGATDKIQCDEFEAWLNKQGATYARKFGDRAVSNIQEDVARKINDLATGIYYDARPETKSHPVGMVS